MRTQLLVPLLVYLAAQVLVGPGAALADMPAVASSERSLQGEDMCRVALPDDLLPGGPTGAERFAWAEICAGRPADMSRSGEADELFGCNAHDRERTWPQEQTLRAMFVEIIATRKPFVDAPARRQVAIRCARIDGRLDLDLDVVPQALRLEDVRFGDGMSAVGAYFADDVSLAGSSLRDQTFAASRVEVRGGLDLGFADFGDVELSGATIDGAIRLDGATITGFLAANGVKVGGNLLVRDFASFGNVMLDTARISGDLTIRDSTIWNGLIGNGLRVGGAAFLDSCVRIGHLDLTSARIEEDLVANALRIIGLVDSRGNPVMDPRTDRGPPASWDGTGSGIDSGEMEQPREGCRFAPPLPTDAGEDPSGSTAEPGGDMSGPSAGNSAATGPAGATPGPDGSGQSAVARPPLPCIAVPAGGTAAENAPTDPLAFGSFVADSLQVGGRFFLRDARIRSGMMLNEARIDRTMLMGGTRVCGTFGGVALQVGGGLWADGARLDGMVDLRKARIGELRFSDGGAHVIWGPHAELMLNNADIGVLQARMPDDWVIEGNTGAGAVPLKTHLVGLRYDRLGADAPPDQTDRVSDIDAAPLIDWVRAALKSTAEGGEPTFVPQPFRQLEQTLRGMGADAQANDVKVAGHLDQMSTYAGGFTAGWLRWLADGVWWALVGFGAYPFRVLWWFAALVGIGVVVARQSGVLCRKGWTGCFWYSLENAFPLLQPSVDNEAVVHDHPFLRNFFHFQKVAGFVLATILVGALTLLGG